MSFYSFTRVSQNAKTGPIAVVTASKDTCPSDCPLKDAGCYAEQGPINLHWSKLDKKGLDFHELLLKIRQLPRGSVWRYAQAGDLPNDEAQIIELAKANRGKVALAYTHKRDFELYRHIQDYGMFVNLSASTVSEADKLAETGLPVTVVLPSELGRVREESLREYRDRVGGRLRFTTENGNRIAICPATYLDTDCARCQACAQPRVGSTIIGFPSHGTRRRTVDKLVGSIEWNRTRKFLRPSLTSART